MHRIVASIRQVSYGCTVEQKEASLEISEWLFRILIALVAVRKTVKSDPEILLHFWNKKTWTGLINIYTSRASKCSWEEVPLRFTKRLHALYYFHKNLRSTSHQCSRRSRYLLHWNIYLCIVRPRIVFRERMGVEPLWKESSRIVDVNARGVVWIEYSYSCLPLR